MSTRNDDFETLERLRAALGEHGLELGDEIGRGGTAVVYRARDLKHERDVAVKVLRPELAQTLSGGRFMREIQLLAHLHHPHVVPLFDSGRVGEQLYYVMPFIAGETLAQRIAREGRLPIAEAVAIAREIADALAYAHARGVIHRDIKPGNVLLAAGHAVVTDFGIAAAVSRAEAEQRGGERLTGIGVGVGTAEYVSPEQAQGRPLDARSDIYSLGCVLYEMLLGRPPFTGRNPDEIVQQRLVRTPAPVRERRPDVPEWLDAAVMKALARDPAARWSTASEFADALAQRGREATTGEVATSGRSTRRLDRLRAAARHRVSLATAGLAAILLPAILLARDDAPELSRVRVTTLENRTGDPSLDVLGHRASDWIVGALARMPGVEVLAPAGATRAGTLISGAYYRSGDRLEIRAAILDASADRALRAIGPIWTSSAEPDAGLEALGAAVAAALESVLTGPGHSRDPARARTDHAVVCE